MNQRIVQRLFALGLFAMIFIACGGNEPAVSPTPAPNPTSAESTVESTESDAPAQPEDQPAAESESSIEQEQVAQEQNQSSSAAETTGDDMGEAVAAVTFQMEAWADNWFAAYLGEELIVEDSVSINTERSFNAEIATFEASYPLHLSFILKDFKQNDTGLEYIGARNQQMGDGGFIMQLTDLGSGAVVVVSNADWACTVIHEAPLDKSCENEPNPVAGVPPCAFSDLGEPEGWKTADFDDSSRTAATVHSVGDVSPKGGYDRIRWDANAQLIWGPDLESDNTILCRVTVADPSLN